MKKNSIWAILMVLMLAFTTGEAFAAKAKPVTTVIQDFEGPSYSLARNSIWTETTYSQPVYCDEDGCSGGNFTDYGDDWFVNIANNTTYKGKTIKAATGNGFLSFSSEYDILSVMATPSFEAFAGDKLSLSYFRKGGSMPANDNFAVWAETWTYNEKTDEFSQTIVKLVSASVLDGDVSWTKVSDIVLPTDGWYSLMAVLSNVNGSSGTSIAGLDDITLTSTKSGGGKGLAKFDSELSASPVPVPGAVWLLGSALFPLITRRRKTAI